MSPAGMGGFNSDRWADRPTTLLEFDIDPFIPSPPVKTYEDSIGKCLPPGPTMWDTELNSYDIYPHSINQDSQSMLPLASFMQMSMNDTFASPQNLDTTTIDYPTTSPMQATQAFVPVSEVNVSAAGYSSDPQLDTYTQANWQWPTIHESNHFTTPNFALHRDNFQPGQHSGLSENSSL